MRPIQLKKGFSSIQDHFGQLGIFFSSRSEAEKLACSDKKKFCSNLVPKVSSFYIRTKSILKNRVTAVHPRQCKTNFFIRLCFWGRNLRKLKNIHLGKASINIKKLFYSFTIVKTRIVSCLHSSTCLDLSSNSSTLVYIRLVTRLHSSKLVQWLVRVFRTDVSCRTKQLFDRYPLFFCCSLSDITIWILFWITIFRINQNHSTWIIFRNLMFIFRLISCWYVKTFSMNLLIWWEIQYISCNKQIFVILRFRSKGEQKIYWIDPWKSLFPLDCNMWCIADIMET